MMVFIQAEEGKEFQQYVDKDGKQIPSGKTVGVEMTHFNGEVSFHLLTGIFFSNN